MPELWQSDVLLTSWPEIFCLVLLPGAARPRHLHYQKKALPIRLLVKSAERYHRVKAEVAISVNRTLRPQIGILIRLRSFSPGCCMRDTASPAVRISAIERALRACHRFKRRRRERRERARRPRKRQTFFHHSGMLYVKKMVPLRHRGSLTLGAENMECGLGRSGWTYRPMTVLNKSLGGV